MTDLFHAYWWVLFPLFGLAFAGWGMWLDSRRKHDALAVIRSYSERGLEPPAEVLELVRR